MYVLVWSADKPAKDIHTCIGYLSKTVLAAAWAKSLSFVPMHYPKVEIQEYYRV